MGVPQSHDEDLLQQAKRLVIAMHNDPRVDVKRDWKLVTVITGHNDLCSGKPCFPVLEEAAQEHAYNLRRALDFLHDNLPRTFVSLLPVLDVTAGWSIEKSLVCRVMSIIECRCLYATMSEGVDKLHWMQKLVDAFHRAERELVENGRYDTRDDFTVELQTFTEKLVPPYRVRNFLGFDMADLSLFSVDCFHLSQKGHAAFATMQWNNQLEPEGNKTHTFLWPLQHLACPSDSAPYFFTRRNSRTFRRFGHQ
ncbi:hypothetical protein B566_EDAN004686 [Ephemera danica]|nr:hypothetical protein B566_EDAN004686 [Ephemera danica]